MRSIVVVVVVAIPHALAAVPNHVVVAVPKSVAIGIALVTVNGRVPELAMPPRVRRAAVAQVVVRRPHAVFVALLPSVAVAIVIVVVNRGVRPG